MARLLVVEDRDSLRRMLERALTGEGYEVDTADDVPPALARLAAPGTLDLVLTDLRLPSGSGLEVLAEARRQRPELPVVVLTAFGTVPGAVEAMKLGAADFLEKPVDLEALFALVRALARPAEEPALFEVAGAPPIAGAHPRLRSALRLLKRVAPSESTVLLTGESGTGKELFARALHALSPRARGPFVAVNCAAIPETLSRASCSVTRRDRSRAPTGGAPGASSRRAAARSCSTRSASCRSGCRPRCCACSTTAPTSASAVAPRPPTRASWRPPTATCAPWWRRAPSAPT